MTKKALERQIEMYKEKRVKVDYWANERKKKFDAKIKSLEDQLANYGKEKKEETK